MRSRGLGLWSSEILKPLPQGTIKLDPTRWPECGLEGTGGLPGEGVGGGLGANKLVTALAANGD